MAKEKEGGKGKGGCQTVMRVGWKRVLGKLNNYVLQKFFRASRGIPSKTVLVESEESNSDYRASGNRVT